MKSHISRLGLIIAYAQARTGPRQAVRILRRQKWIIEEFQRKYCIPIDRWYYRAKGLSPIPTVEQLIEAGEVYAVIVTNWDKFRGCEGHWPDVWRLCNEHQVRKVCIENKQVFCARGERGLFGCGYWDWPKGTEG